MRRFIVALNKSRRIPDVILYARCVADRLPNEPLLASPPIPLAVFNADIAAAQAAEVRVLTRALDAVAVRNEKLRIVYSDLDALQAYVQHVADENPAIAASIIENAGMSVKDVAGPSKPPFDVKLGRLPGSVRAVARAEKSRASYDWEYGTDGKSWTRTDSTSRAYQDIDGLTPGVRYYFRYRASTKGVAGAWSQIVSIIVQ